MKRVKKVYSAVNLMNALQDVKDGKYNITSAAKIHNVPRQTLADKVKGRSPAVLCRPGPHPLLGLEVEERLKNWAIQNTELGFFTTKDAIIFSVQKIIESNTEHMQHYFKNRSLGAGWYKAFRKRFPEVVLNKMESCLNYNQITKSDIRTWFRKVRKYLGKNAEILIDPERIFCMGDVLLSLNSSVKHPSCPTSEKENIIAIFASNAEAKFAPPMINFKYLSMNNFPDDSMDADDLVTHITAGRMNCRMFYNYFVNVFYPHLVSNNVEFPIALFLDARIAYTSLALGEFCEEKGIYFISFLPNAIQMLHPLESGFFQLFKEMWKTEVKFWPARNNNIFVKEENVETIISNIMQFTEFRSTMKKAFRKCGLFPFDVNVIDHSSNAKESQPHLRSISNFSDVEMQRLKKNSAMPTDESATWRKELCDNIDCNAVDDFIIEDYIIEEDLEDEKNCIDNVNELPESDLLSLHDESENYAPSTSNGVIFHQKRNREKLTDSDSLQNKRKKLDLVINMVEKSNFDLNFNVEETVASQDDNEEILRKKNKDLQGLLEKVIDLLKEKTNVCVNLEKQNSALNLQIVSLKDIVSITKNLLSIRNMEVENMQNDMTSLQDKINAEKERHNKMIEAVSSANKLNDDIKGEYQNQMNLFQQLREKYNEKVSLLTQENQKLKTEIQNLKTQIENQKNDVQ